MTNYDTLKEYEAHQTPVPSYEEWLEKTKSLKVLAEAYCKEKQQNAQLKELLKEAETQIIAYKNNDTLPERAFYEKEVEELLAKIDEVLK